MTGARVTHAIADDHVWLTISEPGRPARQVRVAHATARRLAWALLADLDPAEAMRVADEDLRAAPMPWDYRPADRKRTRPQGSCHAVQGNRAGTISNAILHALKSGGATSSALAEVVKRPASNVAAMCCGMVKAGIVEREIGGDGAAIWSLTAVGQTRVAA